MAKRLRSYESDDIVVDFDARRCIHAAECVRGLPEVFDSDRRPWVDPSRGDAASIAEVVQRCPTGALHYRLSDGGPEEAPPTRNTVRVTSDGPLFLRGRLRIALPEGEVLEETRAALCRCGHSKNKPFCDDAHFDAGFEDPGVMVEVKLKSAGDDTDEDVLEVNPAENGPVLIRGPVEVIGVDGASAEGRGGALCRCGGSGSKPFCDGTHKQIGFEAD